ncbi:MAG: helix-turn-helix transcriptional regulator [Bacilli bacterium]|nr:helix-turn-helix transcriptional regulator [Bacilli bacterium]
MRYLISAHKEGITTYTNEEYTEANWWYVNYLEFMKGLTEKQKEYIRTKEKGHIPEYNSYIGEDIDIIYSRWLEIVAGFKLNRLESITNEEVGEAIKRARLFKCMNRAQVAEVIGIKADNLRFYEEGKRTLPFDIFYKLNQIFDLDISK